MQKRLKKLPQPDSAPLNGGPSKEQLSVYMSALGKKGGQIGGKRRLETMTAKERREVAMKAAQARWKNRTP